MQPFGGFWIRVLAYIIDVMILQLASSVFMMIALGVLLAAAGSNDTIVGAAVVALYGLLIPLNWLYFSVLESSVWQGTLGKQAFKLVVTDAHGERIGFGRATGRYFAKFLSTIIFLFGFFMVGWTQRKQGLHDLVAGTLVQRADSPFLASNSAKVFE